VGLFDGRIVSLPAYHAPPVKRFWLFIISEFIGFTWAGITGIILWKVKEEKAMMKENCADIIRGSLDPTDYSQLGIHYQSVKEVINEIKMHCAID
jgi:hypothetical protein